MSGTLSTVLMANNNFINVLEGCYNETPALVCSSGSGVLLAPTISNNITIYLAGAQWSGNDQADHCSFLYQIGNAAWAARPVGGYLLKDVTHIAYLGSNYFRVYLVWQKYMCALNGGPK
jgi:hypothetical protein